MLLVIDNYDSFTYNLVQYCAELGSEVVVRRNDTPLQELVSLHPSAVIVSPGPCSPTEAGVSIEAIRYFAGRVPVLGVCLGHQSLAVAFGGRVIRAATPVHGKTSMVNHNGDDLFCAVPSPFRATRYHSLEVDPATLPASFTVTARVDDVIMAMRHEPTGALGVQFHPESILTDAGKRMLANFLATAA
ncbi:aminodeoxychorismate/anthranilate synthase component II [Alicyclobacillus fastidiosus]|uniref:Aminodeoxychorismate/anthranilate synthase component II n=1 Tax=Alicyclobacillus fastidiosus TaxID=392011 RepID=A0ABY6ZCP7_9BACL|nr:aminodeoxychorismate/anthranilate synthase component II [Alicyclobacillus fastidiosus]WAH40510.1 aminodeoxychorismate/anthranilate synthase component II [Alicyclobacillus fastidiosus]GMA61932.1 glutamine amidotransferase [Alicyclobacillus fastidiosus]